MDTVFDKSPIRKELERAQRKLAHYQKAEEEERSNRPRFDFGKWFDRTLLEIAVHIPVGVAIVVSCYGAQQYGDFGPVFMAMSVALSLLLSRAYSMLCNTHRLDVAAFLVMLGVGAFCWEAYWVHLGFDRFNHQNAADGLMTFADEALIAGSVMLGLFNLFGRRAFITGHDKKWSKRRNTLISNIGNTQEAPRLRTMPAEAARECYRRNGGWPLGYVATDEDMRAVAEAA